jgi:hypothetical protein
MMIAVGILAFSLNEISKAKTHAKLIGKVSKSKPASVLWLRSFDVRE